MGMGTLHADDYQHGTQYAWTQLCWHFASVIIKKRFWVSTETKLIHELMMAKGVQLAMVCIVVLVLLSFVDAQFDTEKASCKSSAQFGNSRGFVSNYRTLLFQVNIVRKVGKWNGKQMVVPWPARIILPKPIVPNHTCAYSRNAVSPFAVLHKANHLLLPHHSSKPKTVRSLHYNLFLCSARKSASGVAYLGKKSNWIFVFIGQLKQTGRQERDAESEETDSDEELWIKFTRCYKFEAGC